MKQKDELSIIILTVLLAGTLDIAAASTNSYLRSQIGPVIVLQYIASGVLGRSAFSGGWGTALLGLLFHYIIAFIWTFLFFKIYPYLKINPKYQAAAGLVYGVIIWLVMNMVVLPLSNVRHSPFQFEQILLGIVFLMFFIGLPISFIYHKFVLNSLKEKSSVNI